MSHSSDAFTEEAGASTAGMEQRTTELEALHGLEEQRKRGHAA
ncbi:hypothetical protein ACIPJS_39640 [Streptomyces sp. NPDC086783]